MEDVEIDRCDPERQSFFNINNVAELMKAKEMYKKEKYSGTNRN